MPVLNNTSKCMCTWAGVIEIVNPGTTKGDPLRGNPDQARTGTANKANCNSTFRPRVCTMTERLP